MICKEIDYIRKVIENYELSPSWLCKQLGNGWTKQRLNYLLNCGKEISSSAYRELRIVFDKYNFVIDDFEPLKKLEVISDQINLESAHLVHDTINAIEDHTLTDPEKADILLDIKHIENRIEKIKALLK
jgi:hypothetical protein